MSYPSPIQWDNFQAYLIWADGTFKVSWRTYKKPDTDTLWLFLGRLALYLMEEGGAIL